MKPDVMADRRVAFRYPLILIAEITEIVSGTKSMARTADVSRTGCYVDTLKPSPKGTQIELRLIRGEEVFQAQALVMYSSPGLGMGVRFNEQVPGSQLNMLDRWLMDAARNP
jgi:PilZ domain